MFTLTQDSDVFLVETEGGMTRDEAEQLGHKLLRLVDADPAEQIAAWLEEHAEDSNTCDYDNDDDSGADIWTPSIERIAAAIRAGRWRK